MSRGRSDQGTYAICESCRFVFSSLYLCMGLRSSVRFFPLPFLCPVCGRHTLGCSSAGWSWLTGALVAGAFSFAGPVVLRFGAVLLYSLAPLDASDLESSTRAAVRWRGGAMADGGGAGLGLSGTDGINGC